MDSLQQTAAINGAKIRIDNATMQGSAVDVACLVTQSDARYAGKIIRRLLHENSELGTKCPQLRINGKGRLTTVADAATLIELIFLLPGRMAKEFRRQCALTICRILGGDVSLIPEIRAQNARVDGTLTQRFLLHPVQCPDTAHWKDKRECMRVETKTNSAALQTAVPNATREDYAWNNGMLNKSATKPELKRKLGITGRFVARDHMVLSLLCIGTIAATRAMAGDQAKRVQDLTETHASMGKLLELSGLKYLKTSPTKKKMIKASQQSRIQVSSSSFFCSASSTSNRKHAAPPKLAKRRRPESKQPSSVLDYFSKKMKTN